VEDKDLRTIKIECPLGEETDVFIIFTGKRPGTREFTNLRGLVNLVENTMVPAAQRKVVDPDAISAQAPEHTRKKAHKPFPRKNKQRWDLVIEEFKKHPSYPQVPVFSLAKSLNMPYSSVQNILKRSGLLAVREESQNPTIEETKPPPAFESPMD
jgi:hypothetical protein